MPLVNIKRRAEGTRHEGETFEGLDFRSMKAFRAIFKNCRFLGCKLDCADLRGVTLDGCEFRDCSMQLADLSTATVDRTTFHGCNMEQASFYGAAIQNSGFLACRMTYGETLFKDATVAGKVILARCNLHGSCLDFREVPRETLSFDDCNLWGCKISVSCAFFNARLDSRLIRQFLAVLGRASGDARIVELAGEQYPVVCRAMDGDKWDRDSTTSPATGLSPTRNSQDQTGTTQTPILQTTPMMTEGV